MPIIRPSADLRNNYSEISDFCNKHQEPIFITKNGKGDLAVMSIETYEKLVGRLELYKLIDAGLDDVKNHRTKPAEQMIAELREEIKL